jgi:cell wall-associated NlpC family hydrolase
MTSLAAALTGKVVPRDASEQFKCGKEVALDQVRQDDVAFFANATGKITHVGVCDGDGRVIHASGEVRIDRLVGTQLQRHEDQVASHHLAGIKRWS